MMIEIYYRFKYVPHIFWISILILSYSERAKNVSAYFCHSILVFCLMNNKDRMTKTRVNIFRSVF